MPVLLNVNGFRFAFFSADCKEPRHVHVRKAGNEAKYWLDPVGLAYNYGFRRNELQQIERIIEEHHTELAQKWDEFCGGI